MRFILADKNRFPLKGTNNRFYHMATIHYGVREFMYFIDTLTQKTYIEEVTGAKLEYIEDNNLWNDLGRFLHEQGVDQMV